jgi:hypothetical protein
LYTWIKIQANSGTAYQQDNQLWLPTFIYLTNKSYVHVEVYNHWAENFWQNIYFFKNIHVFIMSCNVYFVHKEHLSPADFIHNSANTMDVKMWSVLYMKVIKLLLLLLLLLVVVVVVVVVVVIQHLPVRICLQRKLLHFTKNTCNDLHYYTGVCPHRCAVS